MAMYFDIEILDWFSDPEIQKLESWRQHSAMRFGLACTYAAPEGKSVFWPNEIGALWRYLTIAPAPIVTWNGDQFDIPFLIVQAIREGYTYDPWKELPESLDLMALIRRESKRLDGKERWYKLEVIAEANLGRGKIGHGDEAAQWLQSGDPDLVARCVEYCHDDVTLVRLLHEKLLSGEGLICPARPERREYKPLTIFL